MMSEIIGKTTSLVESISSSIAKLATVIVLVGLLFSALGILEVDGTKIASRPSPSFPPFILGIVLVILGLLLVRKSSTTNTEPAKSVVFYTPTIKGNSFFMELLDYSLARVKQKGYKFEIEKGDLDEFHNATNYTDIIRKYSGRTSNSVLIMIPPRPAAYKDIWKLDLEANLITLDMDVEDEQVPEDQRGKFYQCPFHKRVILVDNQCGAMLAAEEIVSFCKTENIPAINTIICEGDFHARGKLFKIELERLAEGAGLEISFLGEIEKLSFSDAIKDARNYIQRVLREATEDLKERDTFIFCANDNLAIGARMEISQIPPGEAGSFKPIRIICFDASTFVKMHMDLGDQFFWRAIDQGYTKIVGKAIESAELLLEGQDLTKEKLIKIRPTVYKRSRRTVRA